jgi:hypothetical protein
MTKSRLQAERESTDSAQLRNNAELLHAPSPSLIDIQGAEFKENLWRKGFKVNHNLCGCPELQLPSLVDLAQRLPSEHVVYYSGEVDVNQPDPYKRPRNGLCAADTIRQIEESRSWMALRHIEADPQYKALLEGVLEEVYAAAGCTVSGTHREAGFIFVASPNSITPFHIDDEHNFLLQIRGSKEISIWDPMDRAVISEECVENKLQLWKGEGYHNSLPFEDSFQPRASVFHLDPGGGVYFPVGAPHWVKNGPLVSISFSVTFRSAESRRQATVYFMNRKLRKLGLDPVPPGQSGWRDSVKFGMFEAGHRTAGLVGRSWFRKNQNKWA